MNCYVHDILMFSVIIGAEIAIYKEKGFEAARLADAVLETAAVIKARTPIGKFIAATSLGITVASFHPDIEPEVKKALDEIVSGF